MPSRTRRRRDDHGISPILKKDKNIAGIARTFMVCAAYLPENEPIPRVLFHKLMAKHDDITIRKADIALKALVEGGVLI